MLVTASYRGMIVLVALTEDSPVLWVHSSHYVIFFVIFPDLQSAEIHQTDYLPSLWGVSR